MSTISVECNNGVTALMTRYSKKLKQPTCTIEARSTASNCFYVYIISQWLVLQVKLQNLLPTPHIRTRNNNLEKTNGTIAPRVYHVQKTDRTYMPIESARSCQCWIQYIWQLQIEVKVKELSMRQRRSIVMTTKGGGEVEKIGGQKVKEPHEGSRLDSSISFTFLVHSTSYNMNLRSKD
ncbi:hypothetical protein C4D60_Mb04t08150 [Musa balbisiana]|uniref:Uncharacterized protein n=1 Tax=Musa balbisiana TaxID=52838 RepID=A0A4S8KAH5_MUSBA|nr:hypothetical protein C4D60_Mb04t08150 [Musa balbisiana]